MVTWSDVEVEEYAITGNWVTQSQREGETSTDDPWCPILRQPSQLLFVTETLHAEIEFYTLLAEHVNSSCSEWWSCVLWSKAGETGTPILP
jgi:hypothetical protein